MLVTTAHGPRVTDDGVEFALADTSLVRVALLHELVRPRRVEFEGSGKAFRLRFPRPDVDRLEYLLELTSRRGATRVVPDPTNPLRVRGPLGEKSVVEFPGYEPPAWLLDADTSPPVGHVRQVRLRSRRLGAVPALLWSPAETTWEARLPLPLVVVHDGPEYAEYASLLRLLDHLVATGETPEFRALLLPPGPRRDELYSASRRYANALVLELLPAALAEAPSDRPPVLVGASLGALAAVHAHFFHPASFGGLFLQSGSFFRRPFDAHERDFPRFARITRFVSEVGERRDAGPVPTTVTCGTGEENLANNQALASTLAVRGWPVKTFWSRDAHNWTAWRDALHPHLAELLLRAWA